MWIWILDQEEEWLPGSPVAKTLLLMQGTWFPFMVGMDSTSHAANKEDQVDQEENSFRNKQKNGASG